LIKKHLAETVMDNSAFTEVEKVILITGGEIFAKCSDQALAKIAKVVQVVRADRHRALPRRGPP
jgi:hypothetical protein